MKKWCKKLKSVGSARWYCFAPAQGKSPLTKDGKLTDMELESG